MTIANKEIRKVANDKGVRQWQIAEVLGIDETSLSRKMRHELSDEYKEKYLNAIDQVERGVVNG